jgi:Ca2+/Na+ antiporter
MTLSKFRALYIQWFGSSSESRTRNLLIPRAQPADQEIMSSHLAAGYSGSCASAHDLAAREPSVAATAESSGGHAHGEHSLLQWRATRARTAPRPSVLVLFACASHRARPPHRPDTWGARLSYLAGFPFALLFHFTVPNCAVEKWRSWYNVTMLMSIVWLGVLVFFMIQWAEKAGCLLGISPTLMGLTVCAIGTSVA